MADRGWKIVNHGEAVMAISPMTAAGVAAGGRAIAAAGSVSRAYFSRKALSEIWVSGLSR